MVFVFLLFTYYDNFWSHPCCSKWHFFIRFHDWVTFYCVYIQFLVYPLICRWIFRFFSHGSFYFYFYLWSDSISLKVMCFYICVYIYFISIHFLTLLFLVSFIGTFLRKQWHPTPVLLPGKAHGRRSLEVTVHGVAKSRTRLSNFIFTIMHWRRKWQPTPVFLPGESQGREPGGLPSMGSGSHRVGHDWSDLAAAVARFKMLSLCCILIYQCVIFDYCFY